MISFDALFEYLQRKHKPAMCLVKDKIIGGGTYTRLRAGQSVSTDTIDAICNYLHCKPADVMKYIPDNDNEEK